MKTGSLLKRGYILHTRIAHFVKNVKICIREQAVF